MVRLTKEIILNLKALAFNRVDQVQERFDKIKAKYQSSSEVVSNLLTYF